MADNKRLLTPEEQDNCTPTDAEIEAYLATPDDAVAASIKNSITRRHIAKAVLYGEKITKAADAKTHAADIEAVSKLVEQTARLNYEFGSPRAYWNWDKAQERDKEWHLRLAQAIIDQIIKGMEA